MSSITKAQERVEKWQARVSEEEAQVEHYNGEMRKYMSPRNPRARQQRRYRDQAQSRLSTARRRLRDAEQTLAAITPKARTGGAA